LRTEAERKRFVNQSLPLTVTWFIEPGGLSARVLQRPPGLVDDFVEVLQLELAVASAPGTTVTGSGGCGPAKRHGKTVDICSTTTRTCTPTKIAGKVKQHCTTKTTTMVSNPKG
jgi:hypothetical protein